MSVLRGKVTTLMQVCLLSSFFCNFVNHNTMEKDSNNIYLVDRKPRKCPCCGAQFRKPIIYRNPEDVLKPKR